MSQKHDTNDSLSPYIQRKHVPGTLDSGNVVKRPNWYQKVPTLNVLPLKNQFGNDSLKRISNRFHYVPTP